MDRDALEDLFLTIYDSTEDVEGMIDMLRSHNSIGEITDNEYHYIMEHWDEFLDKCEDE